MDNYGETAKGVGFMWSLQRVVGTDIGMWTSHEEPYLVFNIKSLESAGSTFSKVEGEEIFQLNFKSGKTVYVKMPEKLREKFWESVLPAFGNLK